MKNVSKIKKNSSLAFFVQKKMNYDDLKARFRATVLFKNQFRFVLPCV